MLIVGQDRGQFAEIALFCRLLVIALCIVAAGLDSEKENDQNELISLNVFFNYNCCTQSKNKPEIVKIFFT